jgi:hypothetical protein
MAAIPPSLIGRPLAMLRLRRARGRFCDQRGDAVGRITVNAQRTRLPDLLPNSVAPDGTPREQEGASIENSQIGRDAPARVETA